MYYNINKRDKHYEREVKHMKQYKITTESGKQLFDKTYNEREANSIWEMLLCQAELYVLKHLVLNLKVIDMYSK